jgi:hypothetical protein
MLELWFNYASNNVLDVPQLVRQMILFLRYPRMGFQIHNTPIRLSESDEVAGTWLPTSMVQVPDITVNRLREWEYLD